MRTIPSVLVGLLLLGAVANAQTPTSVRVTDDSAVVFAKAQVTSARIATVAGGDVADVIGQSGDWYHVIVTSAGNTIDGWIHASSAEPVGAAADTNEPENTSPVQFRNTSPVQFRRSSVADTAPSEEPTTAVPTTPPPDPPSTTATRPTPPAAPANVAPLVFRKVDFFEMQGEDEKKRDARLELDPAGRILTLSDEKRGVERATYLQVRYDQITKIASSAESVGRYPAT